MNDNQKDTLNRIMASNASYERYAVFSSEPMTVKEALAVVASARDNGIILAIYDEDGGYVRFSKE